MKSVSIGAVALLLLTSAALASAGERQGKLQKIRSSDRVIVLEDGTKLWLAEGLAVKNLQQGVTVKLSYEVRDGKHVVTSVTSNETAE